MPIAISIDGVLGGADASVSALDAGFLYGDSVFETMRAYRGRVLDLGPHLDRLFAAAAAIELAAPPRGPLEAALAATVAAAAVADLRVRAIVTAGRTDVTGAAPTTVITAEPCPPLGARPIALAWVDRPLSDRRTLDPSLKTGSYLANRLAQRDARVLACDEALRQTLDGAVASGATSNLFVVADGALVTPATSTGIRAGVTRARVLALAGRLGLAVDERRVATGDVYGADELFVTSSIRGVAPVWRVVDVRDGAVDWPAPGPVTREIVEAYRGFATGDAG